MSLNSINKYLTNNFLWVTFSFVVILFYLSPLVINNGVFYTPVFDNLDSTVVWYKILAESGMIFADNNSIIPNMMNGLPRSSYPGEFNTILWLYYFFTPQTAYVINEIIIHLVAFFSMYIFLKRYIVQEKKYYQNVPIFAGALYFALIPYWSGAGLTIAILPLITYSLLNIKNQISTKWDWLLLILLPLYSSFIFLYMFYIIMAGIYMVWDSIKNRQLNKPFFLALFLMGTVFLLSEYRLVLAMFIDSGFISHRTEFDIFFKKDFLDVYRFAHLFILDGHISHASGLQARYVLPTIIIAMIVSLSGRRFNSQESTIIWIILILSFILNIWSILLTQIYTIPILSLFVLYIIFTKKKYRIFTLLLLLQFVLAILASLSLYNGFENITNVLPILKELNITRIAFIEPFIWGILFAMSLNIIIKKLYYSHMFIILLLIFQFIFSLERSFYQNSSMPGYASFQNYYAPKLFQEIKKRIPEPIQEIKVVSYGLEPIVSLYNNFYTIDGYSVNYPLEYKKKFRRVIADYLDKDNNVSGDARKVYDDWGGKVYILNTTVTLDFYKKDIVVEKPSFNSSALCDLNVDYLISSRKLLHPTDKQLTFIDKFTGEKNSWDIYLYQLRCE